MEKDLTVLEGMRRGIGLAREGNRAGAAEQFEKVLAQRPDHEEALIWKAAVVFEPAEAIRCLEHALRLNPDNQRARVGLEWAYKRQKSAGGGAAEQEKTPAQKRPLYRPDVPAATATPTFQPGMRPGNGPEIATRTPDKAEFAVRAEAKDEKRLRAETKDGQAPYKKHRLPQNSSLLPDVELPPEALPWTKSTSSREAARKQPRKSSEKPASPLFQAASPPVSFTVSPRVSGEKARRSNDARAVPLRWPLGLFGLALGLALLSFLLSGLAPLLGILALLAALAGLVLFNRAQF